MAETAVPDVLTHYYDAARGPFRSLTALPPDDADRLQAQIVAEARGCQPADAGYLASAVGAAHRRHSWQGGERGHRTTHRGHVRLDADVVRRPACLGVPLARVDPAVVSLTYGDHFVRYPDSKPWRGQMRLGELPDLTARFGLPDRMRTGRLAGPLHRRRCGATRHARLDLLE